MALASWRALLLRTPRHARAVVAASRSGREAEPAAGQGKRREFGSGRGGSSGRGGGRGGRRGGGSREERSSNSSGRRYDSGAREERNGSSSYTGQFAERAPRSRPPAAAEPAWRRQPAKQQQQQRQQQVEEAHDEAPKRYEDDEEMDWRPSGSYGSSSSSRRSSYADEQPEWRPSGSYGSGRGRSSSSYAGDRGGREQQYPVRSNPRDLLFGEVLYGVSPVLAALQAKRRTVHALFLQQGLDFGKRKDAGSLKEALQRAQEMGAAVHETSKHDLNLLSNDRPHQGLVLDVSPLGWQQMDTLPPAAAAAAAAVPEGRQPVWLALDEVVDPQNLGAVIRSAYCLGAAGVLACSRNCAPLSAVVSKASAGVLEVLQLHSCNSLPRTLLDAKEKGWQVLGAAAGRGSVSCRRVAVRQPTVLVVGSEGFGLRTNVRRACDALVRVDMGLEKGGVVDSLNVSVATGILLHQLLGSAGGDAAEGLEGQGVAGQGLGSYDEEGDVEEGEEEEGEQ